MSETRRKLKSSLDPDLPAPEKAEAPMQPIDAPQTRARIREVPVFTQKEWVALVMGALVGRDGAGAFSKSSMLSMKANIEKGYRQANELVEYLTNEV